MVDAPPSSFYSRCHFKGLLNKFYILWSIKSCLSGGAGAHSVFNVQTLCSSTAIHELSDQAQVHVQDSLICCDKIQSHRTPKWVLNKAGSLKLHLCASHSCSILQNQNFQSKSMIASQRHYLHSRRSERCLPSLDD